MVQRDVSLLCVIAWVCWSLTAIVAVVDILTPDLHMTGVTILFSCAGGVLHVRGFIARLDVSVERRERAAFELGRDSVTSLRR
jgi:hypothetical protein